MSTTLKVLRRCLDNPESRKKALSLLVPEHFKAEDRYLFRCISKLHEISNGPISFDTLYEYLNRRKLKERARDLIVGLVADLVSLGSVDNDEFEYSLVALSEDAQRLLYIDKLQEAAKSVTEGKLDDADAIVSKIHLDRSQLILGDHSTSSRNMHDLQFDDATSRHETGFRIIDEVTGGARDSEFWLWAAYLAEFKSTALLSMAHYNFTKGRRILFITLEMDRKEIQRRLICIHAEYLGNAVSYREVEFGNFTNGTAVHYRSAVSDYDRGDNYGDIIILEPAIGTCIEDLRKEIEVQKYKHGIDIVVIDYVQLISASRRRNLKRDELNEVLEYTKQIALDQSVWIISGYQTSTEGRKRAEAQGFYDKWSVSETIGAGRIANVIVWSLQTDDMLHNKEVKIGISKSRNSSTAGSRHFVVADPATGLFSRQPVRMDKSSSFDEEDIDDN